MENPNPDSNYDVFLSSKSGDTDEEPFTSHLYTSLQKAGISVFWDHDDLLPEDEQISPSIVKLIQRSRISVVVLLAGYAGSRRCLEVLEQIIEWRRNAGQFVLPVFLGVSRYDVRYQQRGFGEAFRDLTNRISDKDTVESWKLSFARIFQIQPPICVELRKEPSSSMSVDGNKRWWSDNEVEDVVERAKNLLDRTDLCIAEHLEGTTSRLAHLIPVPHFINQMPEGVLLLGIWGMVGIGKTTLAKAIYNHNREDFEGISFLASIREVWKQDTGHVYLQERLLSNVYKLPRKKIESIEIGKKMLGEKLSHKKILLVLDDVNKLEQLNALCGSREWFGPGSMIIITTRDRSLLREWVHGVEHVLNMIEMDNKESSDLISWYAGRDFPKLSRNIVACTGGLPLALEVLGSNIFKRPGAILDRLEEFPDPVVFKVLKSYINDLHNIEKDIFLDIACFLIGMDRVKVIETLNAFGNLAEKGISALENNGLVTFGTGKKVVGMNILLRDTGREIIREQMRVKPRSRIWDVVLSFKGEDTWATFTSHLYTHLADAKINFFKKDDDEIRRGNRISISQLQAIGRSRVCVVVLSKHYANSRWCLQELEKIMECHKTIAQVVVPIFYGVGRSAVHNQTDEFGEAFQNLLETISVENDKEKSWRRALGEIGNIAGIEIPADSRNEGEDIKNVIEHVTHSLDIMFDVEHPVGLKAWVQDVIKLLNCKKSKDVLLLGIWGMGGSGKTTIAKAIYNRIGRARKYEVRSMLQNISKDWKQDNGQLYLQEKLLSDINNGTKIKIDDVESGKELLIERLRHERILLVLDDVDKLEQLNVLCASRQWFGSDSMIIITTRDKHLLDELGVDHVYRTKEMDESESAMLFSWHAFKQPTPREDFEGLSRDAVAYCGGLPLALVELGHELFGKGKSEWESLLGKYKRSPHPMIQNVLKSFDDLNGKEKYMLSDIAFFLIGMNREEAICRLNAFGDLDEKGISALEDRFLVTVDMKNKLRMHVLLRNKGKEIIHEQMRVELGAWIYDVFVSFIGEECATFTSHLCTCLANAKINFIKDDDEIRRRDRISISLLQEIGRCRISVVVLSRGYANSRWCLQELEKIMKCHKTIGQVVVPVFYEVDPSTVLNQTGQFGEAFQDLLTKFSVESDKENNWRTALRQIGSIAGIVITDSRKGDENIKNVMEHVTHSLGMFVVEHPVGLKARVQDVIQLLNCKMSKDILLLGIWGMGGYGKTTLAKAVYNILSRKYEGRSFLQDISDIWKQDNGRVCLQEKLLSDISTTTNVNKDDMKPGKRILCERFFHERILLVLDDVDDLEQLNALCGSREWFGSDSIIIITTRDKRLLNELGVDHVYRMKEMDESESAMLLSWHAFKQPSPREDFAGLCRDVVAHCGGLPLALEVLGCELFGKDESEWKSLMHGYKRIPHPIIQNVLKRSFDGLGDDRVKNAFLEIACFFVGLDQNEVIQKLNGFGDHLAATSVPVLVEQSLVIVDDMNRLGMHVLLQHMAREIFRQRSRMPSIYDVFFSFGKDTPSSFTSCLIASLEEAGISVFLDDDSLSGDGQISSSLLRVIQRCRLSVVVLSKGDIGSRRCLEVLEQIIECGKIAGQFVLPVFFGISRDKVRYRESGSGDGFGDLTKRISDKDKVENWKIALARMSARRHHMFNYRQNSDKPIENIKVKIVNHAKDLLNKTDLFVAENPVAVESRVRDACQLLTHRKDTGVLLLGIWGMAGIGKTIIAKAIYNQICGNFEGRSFLPNIREVWEQDRRLVYLQELLLWDVYKLPIIKIDSIIIGKKILKNKLSHKRVLLVLDDVNKKEQLDALCGSREWFGPGSVIIITTRDRSLLRALQVDHVYRIKEMDENESLWLLSRWLRFGSYKFHSNDERRKLVASVGGLPLALEVEVLANGSFDGFKEFPHTVVQKAIKTGINDLNDTEKCIFFDIACFLNGMDHEEAMEALNAFKLARNGMRALEDRCFVTIDEEKRLKMHVILRDVGRKIIHEPMKVEHASWKYDVFLSFRGQDTRKIFTSLLHASLANAGIHVFKDDIDLRRGDRISISLLQAIRRSRISIVVLSRHYADSRWCLQELEYIMECRRTIGQVVLPIFYDVDPSEVRNQTCMFGKAFQDLLKKFSVEKDKEKEKSWRTALRDIGSIAGFEIRDNNEGINKIVEDITLWLDKSTFIVAQHPVGLESCVQSVIKLLDHQQSKEVQLLGISGIGGIGKTTIAKAICNQIRHDFDGSCFLLDIREFWNDMTSRLHLQEQILFDVLKKRETINNIESGKKILGERLQHKRVLLILDDVDESDQLEALYWSHEWFGSGSRIIITTRDEGLFRMFKVDHKYRMSEMDNHASIEHFSWHAFKQASPKEDFVELSRDVVAYCGGLPLALQVIGSLLFDKDAEMWQGVLERLKIIPNEKVQKKLRISYDGLGEYTEREIFLDIAFFFIGMDRNDVIHILDGYYPKVGISTLIDRNLVSVDKNNKLRMHNLLRDMGRQIVREESLKEPEKRSRLWLQNDVLKVLQNHQADIDYSVEGLTFKWTGINPICLKTKAFRRMRRLRLLQFAGVQLDGDFVCHDSCKPTWLYWHGYPGSLVSLELESSNLELMSSKTQFLEKLKVLNLSHSHRLTQTPDFSHLPNLEKLLLKDCPSLSEVSETIGDLKNILLINFEKCTRLPNLPRSFYKLKSLETLIISGCSMIDKLEEDVEQMESLTTLLADNTGIKQVPFSMVRSKSIGYISMCGYEGSSRDVFPSLIWSWMSPTNVVSFSSLVQSSYMGLELVSLNVPKFLSLWVRCGSDHQQGVKKILDILDAAYCKELAGKTTSPVSNLESSSLIDFPCQFHISGSAKFVLIEVGMKSQVSNDLREMLLQKLTTSGPDDCLLPSDNYLSWFTFNRDDSYVTFEVPHVDGGILKSMTLCIVYSSSPDTIISECLETVSIQNYTQSTTHVYDRDTLASSEDEEWQTIMSNLEAGDTVEIHVVSGDGFIVKKTAVYLIFDAPTDQKMEQRPDVIVPRDNYTDTGGDENVKDLEKRKSKRKPTSITNSGVSPKAPKSRKITSMIFDATTKDLTTSPERSLTSKVATLIQESSHEDQVLQEKTHATDQLPYIVGQESEAEQEGETTTLSRKRKAPVFKPKTKDTLIQTGPLTKKGQTSKVPKSSRVTRSTPPSKSSTPSLTLSDKSKFEFDPPINDDIREMLKSEMNDKWRQWKHDLKRAFDPSKTEEEIASTLPDDRVDPDQYRALVHHWFSEEGQKISGINKQNRAKLEDTHCMGTKSLPVVIDEKKKKNKGVLPERHMVYIDTRTRKNGTIVNDKAAGVIDEIKKHVFEGETSQASQSKPSCTSWKEDLLSKVQGPENEKRGRVRCLGKIPPAKRLKASLSMDTDLREEVNQIKGLLTNVLKLMQSRLPEEDVQNILQLAAEQVPDASSKPNDPSNSRSQSFNNEDHDYSDN